MYQRLFPYTFSFRFFSWDTCFSLNQRRPLWCFGSGKYFFLRHSCKVETPIPVRSAAWAKEIGAPGGFGRLRSPRLYRLLDSNACCRYSGFSAYNFLRFSESRCLLCSYQLRKVDFFFRISATAEAPRNNSSLMSNRGNSDTHGFSLRAFYADQKLCSEDCNSIAGVDTLHAESITGEEDQRCFAPFCMIPFDPSNLYLYLMA